MFFGSVLSKPWPSHVLTHVAASSSTNAERLSPARAREGFVCVFACTEPAGTGNGAMCVERGGQMWPKKLLNTHDDTVAQTHTLAYRETQNKVPYFRTTCFEEAFFRKKTKKKRLARHISIQPRRAVLASTFFFVIL